MCLRNAICSVYRCMSGVPSKAVLFGRSILVARGDARCSLSLPPWVSCTELRGQPGGEVYGGRPRLPPEVPLCPGRLAVAGRGVEHKKSHYSSLVFSCLIQPNLMDYLNQDFRPLCTSLVVTCLNGWIVCILVFLRARASQYFLQREVW